MKFNFTESNTSSYEIVARITNTYFEKVRVTNKEWHRFLVTVNTIEQAQEIVELLRGGYWIANVNIMPFRDDNGIARTDIFFEIGG